MSHWHQIQTLLSAIYPPRCLTCGDLVETDFGLCGSCWRDAAFIGETICDTCSVPLPGEAAPGEVLICDECQHVERPWSRGRAAMLYRGTGRKLVLALKHGDRLEMVRPAGRWLHLAGHDLFDDPSTLVAPIPLHWLRLAKRRYNQAALLAQAVAKEAGLDCCPDLLERSRATPSLDGKSRDDRFQTLDAALTIHPKRRHRIVGRKVVLVDDVMTSGATFSSAAEACLAAGAVHVDVLCLARVTKDA